ncbi:MAG: M15 family metallopeptidase [Dehalococcoidia bacterium]
MNRRRFLTLTAQAAALPLFAACGRGEATIEVQAPPATTPSVAPPAPTSRPTPAPTPPPYFDRELHLLVSKEHALPAGYVPDGLQPIPAGWLMPGQGGELRSITLDALSPMIDAAAEDGVELRIRSPYRSFGTQAETFAYWVSLLGEEQARRESAEPGHSEHQLGTTLDFADPYNGWELVESFADSPSGLWLEAHAHEYGFVISYPRDAEAITGYIFEPWHFRYVGVEAADAWLRSGLTLIEFLVQLHELSETAPR